MNATALESLIRFHHHDARVYVVLVSKPVTHDFDSVVTTQILPTRVMRPHYLFTKLSSQLITSLAKPRLIAQ